MNGSVTRVRIFIVISVLWHFRSMILDILSSTLFQFLQIFDAICGLSIPRTIAAGKRL